jgi:hypothetical protein
MQLLLLNVIPEVFSNLMVRDPQAGSFNLDGNRERSIVILTSGDFQ